MRSGRGMVSMNISFMVSGGVFGFMVFKVGWWGCGVVFYLDVNFIIRFLSMCSNHLNEYRRLSLKSLYVGLVNL